MRKIIFCFLLFTIVSFDFTRIKVISITYTMTSFAEEDPSDLYNTLQVYLLGQERIYKIPGISDGITKKLIPNSESYFICSEGKSIGTYYKSNWELRRKLNETQLYTKINGLNVDSFLSIHAFGKTNIVEPDASYKKDSKTIGDTLINTFITLDTNNIECYDTITYKFIQFKEKPFFNFAKRMDSVYNKSLFYFSFTHRQKYWPSEKLIIPQHGLKVELSENELNESESKNFIELIHKLKSTYK